MKEVKHNPVNENFLVRGTDSGVLFVATTYKAETGFYNLISLDSGVANRCESRLDIHNERGYKRVTNKVEIDPNK